MLLIRVPVWRDGVSIGVARVGRNTAGDARKGCSYKDLDRSLDSIESLRASPHLQPFLGWIRKQKPERNFRTVMSDAHPHGRRARSRERRKRR